MVFHFEMWWLQNHLVLLFLLLQLHSNILHSSCSTWKIKYYKNLPKSVDLSIFIDFGKSVQASMSSRFWEIISSNIHTFTNILFLLTQFKWFLLRYGQAVPMLWILSPSKYGAIVKVAKLFVLLLLYTGISKTHVYSEIEVLNKLISMWTDFSSP